MTNLSLALIAFGALPTACAPRAALPSPDSAVAPLSPDSAVAEYCAAWSTADRATRDRLLARVWTPDGVYSDPDSTLAAGRAALSDTIGEFLGSHPGAHFRCSSPQVHHGFMRITWILLRGDGAESWRGMDFGELAPDGRIRRITGFFGALPSVAP
jgi:SnoaL-like domain